MKRNIIETALGAVVLLVAIGFLFFAFRATGLTSADSGYEVIGEFDDASGLVPGAEVRMSGVKIGTVLSQSLDPETFFAKVVMSIDDSIRLPTDTSARIVADGLLGGNYVSLEAGADEEFLTDGGEIMLTQSAIVLEQVIGQFLYNKAADGGS